MRKSWRKDSVYVDTNVFIYAMIHTEKVREARLAKEILMAIAKGELDGCTASLTWDELFGPRGG